MTDFKAKLHQVWFRLGLGLLPRPRWGAYLLAVFGGRFAAGGGLLGKRRKRGRGGRGKWRGGKGRAPKLLLNLGPSEPCYATGYYVGRECLLLTSGSRGVARVRGARLYHRLLHHWQEILPEGRRRPDQHPIPGGVGVDRRLFATHHSRRQQKRLGKVAHDRQGRLWSDAKLSVIAC